MTEAEARALGLRAVACKGWEWMPGMWVHATVEGQSSWYRLDGCREGLYKESDILVHEQRIYDDTDDVCGLWPDFRDAATRGCLLDVARCVDGADALAVVRAFDGWGTKGTGSIITGCTLEAEALVAVLEYRDRTGSGR